MSVLLARRRVFMNELIIESPPKGLQRIKWLGPAFIWMLAAAGAGELLFTPRVAAQYGYVLLWAMIASVLLKWFINKEIGRYTVCTGTTIFRGFKEIPGPENWVIWFIMVPQLVVAVASIAGLAGGASTALAVFGQVSLKGVAIVIIALSAMIIWLGQYETLERITTVLAMVRSIAVLVAAISTRPDLGTIAEGLSFQIPENLKVDEVLPWLGFMLAGPAGLMWFSFWLQARGYGAAARVLEDPVHRDKANDDHIKKLKGWLTQLTIANTIAVVGALIIAFAFLILGAELLYTQKLIPEQNKIAETLSTLLGSIWGQAGFYFMLLIVFTTFFSTILSNQDGYGRMFAGGTRLVVKKLTSNPKWLDDKRLQRIYLSTILGVLPMALYLVVGEPVMLLKFAGAIEALQIPILVGFVLYLNLKKLPTPLKPSFFSIAGTAAAGLFFMGFAVLYFMGLS